MLFPCMWLRSTGFPYQWLEQLALPEEAREEPGAFRQHTEDARRRLVGLLHEPLAQEALFLSNPEAVDRLAGLAASDLGRPNSRTRQRLRLAWGYLQRFCVKNETVSFFGPLAWGRVEPAAALALRLTTPDPDLGWLRRRRTSYEHWVVDRLCARIAQTHPGALPLTLNPACDLDGDTLRFPLGKHTVLPTAAARLVRAALDRPGRADAPQHGATVGRLTAARVLTPYRPIAPGTDRPLPRLRQFLAHLPPGDDGFDAVGTLSELERLREDFETADYLRRGRLRGEILATLATAGVDSNRATGTHYAGRSPLYEDCERNLSFVVGGALARTLETGLTPVLRLYRLVAQCAAGLLHDWYAEVLGALGPDGSGGGHDFVVFLNAVRSPAATAARRAVTEELRRTLRAAWAALPPLSQPSDEQLDLDDAALEVLTAALRSAHPRHARFSGTLGVGVVSPDVMLAARGPEAVGDGRLQVVLGEVHPCVLTALQPVPLPFLDGSDRDEALRRADSLLGAGRILLATTCRDHHRSQIAWPVTPNLYEVEIPGAVSRCPAERRIPAGRGRVEVRDGVLHFVDRATGRAEDMVTLLSSDLHHVMFAVAGEVLGSALPHRIVHRGVLVKRRSWTFHADDVPPVTRPAEDHTEYGQMWDWAQARGLPRRSFFKTDTEAKPVFLDWANPLAVDTFAKLAQQGGHTRLTEMRPRPDELWLTGDAGLHTAELRMSFVV